MKITNHTELLNALIEKYNLKSYLEIGVQNPANNFDNIILIIKNGVDPEYTGMNNRIIKTTSDIYFETLTKCEYKFDIIFIDGLHTAEQVKRDFENSLRCLSDNGFIVIHDVLPKNEEGTIVPRQTKIWWGDVYKFAMTMYDYWQVSYKTFNIDNGCMLICKTKICKTKKSSINHKPGLFNSRYSWEDYVANGKTLMNVTDGLTI